jgi:uridylate kinase
MKKKARVMLKLSGEMLGASGFGLDPEALRLLSGEIADVHRRGYEMAVVIGGGNFFRGATAHQLGIGRISVDSMGMLGTCMNALALQAVLEEHHGLPCRVMTAIAMPDLAEPYIRRRALKHLSSGSVVIFAAGTGSPMFTTDTAAALRAREMDCEVVLKATKVDGVYDKDPFLDSTARRYETLTYQEVLSKGLHVMDAAAISLCMEAELAVLVFRMDEPGCVFRALQDPSKGTWIRRS